jgi:hypothetical protein
LGLRKNKTLPCKIKHKKGILKSTETVGETSVSSGCWGEDSNYELAGAAHFHVASPVLLFKSGRLNL